MPTTTTGEAPFTLTSSSRSRTVGVAVTTGTGPFTLTSSSATSLTITPGAWAADVSQAATIIIDTVPAVGRLLPALASPPAGMTVQELRIGADEITPLTVDGDGRVHSDGT